MKVTILQNCFEPGKRTPDVLFAGEVKDLSDSSAEALIEKGYAKAFKAEAAAAVEPQSAGGTADAEAPKRKKKA